MLMVSISRTDAAPTPTAIARRRIRGASRSRWAMDNVFESRTPGIRGPCGFMITAAATTAPHVGATPTSSTPTTRTAPSRQWSRSKRRVGTRAVMGRSGYSATEGPSRRASRPRPGGNTARLASGAALPQRGGLADAIAQEVQLRSTRAPVADDLDLLHARAVDLERPLDADAARDLPNGDRPGDSAAAHAHHGAFEDLDPLLAALD